MDFMRLKEIRERLLLCSICISEFKDPRILPCHHTFCLDCIANITNSSLVRSKIFWCPQCREQVGIPKGGIQKFPINFYLVSLQDELGNNANDGVCKICANEKLQPQFHCTECDYDICRFCISYHRLEMHAVKPNISRIVKGSSSFSSLSTATHVCDEHDEEILQLFCKTCQKAICITCSCSDHKKHNLMPLSKQLQESRFFMQKELDKINEELEQTVESKRLIEVAKEHVKDVSKKTLISLNDIMLEACKNIMEKKLEIEAEILSSSETQIENITDVDKRLQTYVDMLSKGQEFLADLQENDICLETVESFKKYSKKMKEIRDEYTSTNIQIKHTQFVPSQGIKLIDLNFGIVSVRKLFVLGGLGSQRSEKQILYVSPKTLEVYSSPLRMIRFRSFYTVMKLCFYFIPLIILFITLGTTFNAFKETGLSQFLNLREMGPIVFSEFFRPE